MYNVSGEVADGVVNFLDCFFPIEGHCKVYAKVADGVRRAFAFAVGFAASFPVVNFNFRGCSVSCDVDCFVCIDAYVQGFTEFRYNVGKVLKIGVVFREENCIISIAVSIDEVSRGR